MRISSCIWIALALALFFFFSVTYLGLPGLQYDETNFVNAALGHSSGSFIAWSADLFGHKVPLMIMGYIGALKSGIYAPVFKFFGASAATARMPVVLIGAFTLLAAFGLFRRMFDRRVAVVGLLLFALDSTFIFANKLDWGPVSLMLLLELLSLYFMWRWMTDGKNYHVALAGLCFGLGLYNKFIFIWFVIAFFVSFSLFFRKHLRSLLRWRRLIWFVPAFLLGALPLIAFNIDIPMGTFRGKRVMTMPGIETLKYRYLLLRGTLDASGIYYLVNYDEVGKPASILKSPPAGARDRVLSSIAGFSWVRRSPMPFILFAALAWILFLWSRGRFKEKREILFMATQLVIIAGLICLNEEAKGAQHVMVLYPFVIIVIAYALCEFARWAGKSRAVVDRGLMAVCLVPLLASLVVIDARYLKSFQVKGGYGFWSDAIYDLAAFARENPDKNYMLMEWGFSTQLVLLTHGRIQYQDLECGQKTLAECVEPVLTRTNTCFVFHVPPFEHKPVLETFRQALAGRNLQGRILKTFYQRDSRPVYAVYEVVQPAFDAYARKGGFYYIREGEDFDEKSGGGLDQKEGAANKKALGSFWGRQLEDFVSYKFTLPRDIADAHLYLRYAFEDKNPHEYYLLLDGNFIDTFTLPATPGYGYTEDQWKLFEIPLGALSKGPHELKLKPGKQHQLLNLDYWYLTEGRFKPGAVPAQK